MLLTGLFLDLQKREIDSGDICQLLYMKVPQEEIQGVIRTLNYWCCEWKGKRFPSPLNIVYCLDHLKMISLPFFDTAISQDKVLGIALDKLIIHKKAVPQVAIYETSNVLRKCSYETYKSWPGEGSPKYGIRLPTAEEMKKIVASYRDIKATMAFLRDFGVEFDDLSCGDYWTQEQNEPYSMGISLVNPNHDLVSQQNATMMTCTVRPVLNLFEEEKDEGLDFIGTFDKYCLPDKKSEKFAKKLR